MKKVEMKIVHTQRIAKDTVEIQLEDHYITQVAKPGQFLYIALPNFTLRRPISIADVNKEQNRLTILFKMLGKGTAELARYERGRTLDCLGPNGNGFPLEKDRQRKVLLIGGGIGVPPLYYLGKILKFHGNEVISVLGFQNAAHIFYEKEFEELGKSVIVTDDGSYGKSGYVTDILPEVPDFDTFYACGPTGMLRSLTSELRDKPGYISLEERMCCGVGACSACVVRTNTDKGYQKICHDGPVFSSKEVII